MGEWQQAGAPAGSPQWRDACVLAGLMVRGWPRVYQHSGAHAARMLTSLAYLRHTALIDVYMEQVAATGCFAGGEAASLASAASSLDRPRAASLIDAIVAANVSFAPGPCAALLSHCCTGSSDGAAWLAPAVCRFAGWGTMPPRSRPMRRAGPWPSMRKRQWRRCAMSLTTGRAGKWWSACSPGARSMVFLMALPFSARETAM